MKLMLWVYAVCGLIVVAEGLNKLERCRGWRQWPRDTRARAVEVLKMLAWGLLTIGGAGAVATLLLPLRAPDLQDVCVIGGFAVLIVRTRVKEG